MEFTEVLYNLRRRNNQLNEILEELRENVRRSDAELEDVNVGNFNSEDKRYISQLQGNSSEIRGFIGRIAEMQQDNESLLRRLLMNHDC